MEERSSGFIKFLGTKAGKWSIVGVIVFAFYLIGNNSLEDTREKINANLAIDTSRGSNANAVALGQHKVIPGGVQGTTRRVTIIVQSSVTEDEIVAINDKMISNYKSNLTHLNIDYFDNESIAVDYFQKIGTVSEAEGDRMFSHFRAGYTMNTVSGFNKLEYNENGDWKTIKSY